jgi:hypothetical protein
MTPSLQNRKTTTENCLNSECDYRKC